MFDHVTIRVADLEASARFYGTVLGMLGIEPTFTGDELVEYGDFSLAPVTAERPVTRNLHVGFTAASRALVGRSASGAAVAPRRSRRARRAGRAASPPRA